MNPNQTPGPENPIPSGEQPEIQVPPPPAQFEQEYTPDNQVNPEQQPPEPSTATSSSNPYIPPPPGDYKPDFTPGKESLSTPAKVPYVDTTHETNVRLPISEDLMKKRAQAKRLLGIAIGFGVLFVVGLGAVTLLFLNNRETEQETARVTSVDEQLVEDLNTFALGVINFRNGDDFFTITPNDVAELKTSYLPRVFNDPRTEKAYAVTNEIPRIGEIQYVPNATCNEDDSISLSDNDSEFAVRVLLESGVLLCLKPSEVTVPAE